MKNRSWIFIIPVLALVLSCGEKGKEGASVVFQVSPTEVHAGSLGEPVSIRVISPADWLVRSGESWIKVMTASGKASREASTATVMVEENLEKQQRTGTVTVSTVKGESIQVNVTQDAASEEGLVRGIATADDLVSFANAVNQGGSLGRYMVNGVVKLISDIDASSIKEWVSIGTASRPLAYDFDGGGHTIANVHWNVDLASSPNAGLIGYAKGITVRNLVFGSEGSSMVFKGQNSGVGAVGSVVGHAEAVMMRRVTNRVSLRMEENTSASVNIGGLVGWADESCFLGSEIASEGCINQGDLFVSHPCREGGFVGHNEGKVYYCSNYGAVLGKYSSDGILGPAWGCSYNKTAENFIYNTGRGYVGDYDTFKDNPSAATPAMCKNAVVNPADNYTLSYREDSEDRFYNNVDWTLDAYYDWTEVTSMTLHSGVKYTHYDCINVPRHIHVLEIDLSDPSVEVTTAYANEMVPNPNGNNNSNNGKKIRETLSELCARRRSEGQNVLAGINTGFFDSNDGISRGFHVEEGQPVYINNPQVVASQTAHVWAFTIFSDLTASCRTKTFSGRIAAGSVEIPFYTVNDTTLRHRNAASPVNLFTNRYVRVPHPASPKLINDLAANVLYVIAEYTSSPMTVNTGWAEAVVKNIYDGRVSPLSDLPYITAANQVGIALSGDEAIRFYGAVKAGDTIRLRCDIAVDGDASKPILTQNSAQYDILVDGEDKSGTVTSSIAKQFNPMTFPVVSRDGKKIWLVEVDGRQDWYSTGVKAYEMARIALKLGGWNSTRFDGGGSSCMWVYDPSAGKGGLVNRPSDSKGERSCLNYMIIRTK